MSPFLWQALTKIEPDWKTNPIYKSIVTALNAILGIVAAFCPSGLF